MKQSTAGIGPALIAGVLFASSAAWPCLTTPPRYRRPHAQIVDQAKQIVLAKVAGHRPATGEDGVVYELRVTRVLKGDLGSQVALPAHGTLNVGAMIEMRGDTPDRDAGPTFSNHADRGFWESATGRLGNKGDCIPMVTFAVGATYLVLLGDPDDTKDLERIESDEDRWLTFVAKRVSRARR
jgi:hypothetical protein